MVRLIRVPDLTVADGLLAREPRRTRLCGARRMRRLPQRYCDDAVPHEHGPGLAGRCHSATPGELFRDARGGPGACDRVCVLQKRWEHAISSANARTAAARFP